MQDNFCHFLKLVKVENLVTDKNVLNGISLKNDYD